MTWSAADIPPQEGKLAVVTGANSGLGLETTRALAAKGAQVILACRTESKAVDAIEQLAAEGIERGRLEFRACDLSSLDSVRGFAAALRAERPAIDLLINNAGVMALPLYRTAEGFEMQLGTNHFGHFALTGLLLEHLSPSARIVTVSSLMHIPGNIDFEDLDAERGYRKLRAYCQSKLANLLFFFELHRRLESAGRTQLSLASHPGYSATNLLTSGTGLRERIIGLGNRVFAQSSARGALPSLYAATAPGVRGGEFYGPRVLEMWGAPKRVRARRRARDLELARRLWEVSIERTGVDYGGL